MSYETRYFNARIGDVALDCCLQCGNVVWNRKLHEEQHHGNSEIHTVETAAGPIADPLDLYQQAVGGPPPQSPEQASATPEFGDTGSGGGPVRSSDRPASGGTGRTTAAGKGRQGSR